MACAAALELPHTEHVLFHDPDRDAGGITVEFRLVYQGRLPASASGGGGGRIPEKHEIRLHFHRQLKILWNDHPSLRRWEINRNQEGRAFSDVAADKYEVCGRRFLPLITERGGTACSLDILFLRRDQPGGLVTSGGDIDNRIKTLLDALQVPRNGDHILRGWVPAADENPLYCLMEDDKLINDLTVTTDRLIQPLRGDEAVHDVMLVIRVKTRITDHERAFIEFM